MMCLASIRRIHHATLVINRAIKFATLFWLFGTMAAAAATCRGTDLFPLLQAQAPETFGAIDATGRGFPFSQGKLFRLTKGSLAASHIFGTLHLSDVRVTDFSSRVRNALAGAKVVVLELLEDGPSLRAVMAKDRGALKAALLAPQDRRADHLLDSRDFALLEALLESRGLRKSVAKQYKATALALLLDLPSCAMETKPSRPYADEIVALLARERKVEVAALETLAEQLTILDGLPREAERDLLIGMARQENRAEDALETTIARYEVGDIGRLLAWMRADAPFPEKATPPTPPAFLDRLIDARNLRMRDRALPFLDKGGAFIAVGAVHLPGEDGLLRLLEREGYGIERVE
jgi:uncharacterized protein YbaP (TraB family)